jgi:AraC family transcriptional regulator
VDLWWPGKRFTDLSLRTLAATLRMSVYRLVRAFGQSAGTPPHRYALQQRIARSKSLLAGPALSISELALRAGFASQSHFTTAFRRLTSTTPARYRQGVRL